MLSYVIASCSPCLNTWALSETFCMWFVDSVQWGRDVHMQSQAASLPLAEWKVVIILHSLPWWARLCLVLYNYCVSWEGLRHQRDDNTSINTASLCSDGKLLLRAQSGRRAELSDNTAHHRRMWAGFPPRRTIYRQPMRSRARPRAKPSQNSFILGRLVRGRSLCFQRNPRTSQLGPHSPVAEGLITDKWLLKWEWAHA